MQSSFFRGTSLEQDARFSNKNKAMIAKLKCPASFSRKVDMARVSLETLKPWISQRITDLLGIEDDVVVNLCFNMLESGGTSLDPREIQINLTGFLGTNAAVFVTELWNLLLEAQDAPGPGTSCTGTTRYERSFPPEAATVAAKATTFAFTTSSSFVAKVSSSSVSGSSGHSAPFASFPKQISRQASSQSESGTSSSPTVDGRRRRTQAATSSPAPAFTVGRSRVASASVTIAGEEQVRAWARRERPVVVVLAIVIVIGVVGGHLLNIFVCVS
ncbi:unnamed protein product (mitochondrion) [Plasmodiophora brassicae]|uniref:PWI domain-containing protein n=1 Tax=Plasmodiophora brassicae TaxID=37360 RepID=A0A3P3Y2V3_PLABS|nr:unnamed protein product [Plasmodiophora brassicae]